jgi:CheY-like chemotaxis protein/Tfp pilus assembly protein PilF
MDSTQEKTLLERLRSTQTQYESVALKLAEEYTTAGRQQEALALVERLSALTTDPEKKAFYLLTIGRLCEQLSEYEIAASYYSTGLSAEPQDKINWYFLHNNLGQCMNRLGAFGKAEWYCREAIVIDPHRHQARKNLGEALEGQGKLKEAAESYVDAVAVAPTEPQALLRLEHLLRSHPEVAEEVPDLYARLEKCRGILEQMKIAHEGKAQPSHKFPAAKGHIPLVAILDDDDTLVEVIGEEIRRRGGDYVGFARKEEFLRDVEILNPDLIVTDLVSPGMDGMAALERLKANPDMKDVPIILLSGSIDTDRVTLASRLGAYACLPKPFDVVQLFDTMHAALAMRFPKE